MLRHETQTLKNDSLKTTRALRGVINILTTVFMINALVQ